MGSQIDSADVEDSFLEMGFDRIFGPSADLAESIAAIAHDLDHPDEPSRQA